VAPRFATFASLSEGKVANLLGGLPWPVEQRAAPTGAPSNLRYEPLSGSD